MKDVVHHVPDEDVARRIESIEKIPYTVLRREYYCERTWNRALTGMIAGAAAVLLGIIVAYGKSHSQATTTSQPLPQQQIMQAPNDSIASFWLPEAKSAEADANRPPRAMLNKTRALNDSLLD
ncbi:MAG: hypothetical protein V1659_05005 [Candidatus Woesearchaeota archaeon]